MSIDKGVLMRDLEDFERINMEWISVKNRLPDPKKDRGWYVVLIATKPHIVYFSYRNWKHPWHIPDEWQLPTHYFKLNEIKDVFSNRIQEATMD